MEVRPQGRYKGDLEEAVFGFTEGKGTPEVTLRFGITEGAEPGSAYVRLYLVPKGEPKTAEQIALEQLARIGFKGDFTTMEFDTEKSAGVELVLKHEEYQGKPKEKWSIGGGYMPTQAAPDQARAYNAKWKAMFGAKPSTPPGRPAAPPPASRPAPPPPPPDAPSKPVIATKGDAWKAWCAAFNNEPDTAKWAAAVAEVGRDNEMVESQFTAKQWDAVAGMALPF